MQATCTVKYFSKGVWSIRRKPIPNVNEFALKPKREVTDTIRISDLTHTQRMQQIGNVPNAMFVTSSSRSVSARMQPLFDFPFLLFHIACAQGASKRCSLFFPICAVAAVCTEPPGRLSALQHSGGSQ
jgi:hypothetical protein